MGLRRRRRLENARQQDEEIIHVIKEHLNKGGLDNLGFGNLRTYLRGEGVFTSRNDTMRALRFVGSAGVDRR